MLTQYIKHIILEISIPAYKLEMGELTSPYTSTMEGFENPTMARVFHDLLKIKHRSHYSLKNTSRQSTNNVCIPNKPNWKKSLTLENKQEETSTSFLKTLLQQQKTAADSLIQTAKTIGPVAQKIIQMEDAYDADFESDIKANLPYSGSTVQGFTIGFLLISILAFSIISGIAVNITSNNTYYAIGTSFGILFTGIILFLSFIRLS